MVKSETVAALAALTMLATLPFEADAQIRTQLVASGFSQPVAFVQDPSLPNVFYVVEQTGRVRTLENGVLQSTDFADLRSLIGCCGEQGLLGMAFAPDAAENGRVFFVYIDLSGRYVVSRYRRVTSPTPRIDPASRLDLRWSTGQRFIPQPSALHNAGHLAFGSDGYLYIAKGDGGSNATASQNPTLLLGKMLRIDVNVSDSDPNGMRVPSDNPFLDGQPVAAAPEIWAFGFRNPWRYSFDNLGAGATSALFIGDVGAGGREEISHEPRNAGGRNYGWPVREGMFDTGAGFVPAYTPLTDPLRDYGRSDGTTVTGGFVYRGQVLGSTYAGRYFYADFGASRVWSLGLTIDPITGEATVADVREHTVDLAPLGNVSSFGRDAAGELYLVVYGGEVRKIVGVDTTTPGTISNIPDQQVNEDTTTGSLNFTINDVDDPSAQWTVTAISSDTTLIPNANLALTGSGTNRSIAVTPAANRFGVAFVTVTFSSNSSRPGAAVTDTFVVSVNPVNDPPTVSSVPNQVVASGTAAIGPLPVVIGDIETAASALSVTASSSNQAVVTNAGITVGGANESRTLQLALAPGAAGTTVITVDVSDGTARATTTFSVIVTSPPPPPSPAPAPPAPESPTVPAAPRNVAVDVPDGRTVVVRWEPPLDVHDQISAEVAAAITGYQIELGASSGNSDAGIFTTGLTTNFTIGNLAAGQYFVRVRATSDAGLSQPSNEVAVTLDGSSLSPRSPRNVRAMVVGSSVRLAWDAPLDRSGLTAYLVEVGSGPGLANYGQTTVANQEMTTPALPDATYYVRVRSIDATGRGATSNEILVIVGGTSAPCQSPTAPRALAGDAVGAVIQLFWSPPAAGDAPTRYLIHAGSMSGATDIGTVPLEGSFTSAGGPVPDGTYFLRVVAVNACGVSEPSNEVTITIGEPPPAAPGPPGNLLGESIGRHVSLAWAPPVLGGPVTRYIIEVADAAGTALASFDTGNPALSFSHGNVPPGTYLVRVRAANRGGVGPASELVTLVVP
jgi:glucose/arabinose dehydrogenase